MLTRSYRGFKLTDASPANFFVWFASLAIQVVVLVPIWYIWGQGRGVMGVLRKQKRGVDVEGYEPVEQEGFEFDAETETSSNLEVEEIELK